MSADSHRAVFLSYASQDAEVVSRVAKALRPGDVAAWYDRNESCLRYHTLHLVGF